MGQIALAFIAGSICMGATVGVLTAAYYSGERSLTNSPQRQQVENLEKVSFFDDLFLKPSTNVPLPPRLSFEFYFSQGTNQWDFKYADNNSGTNTFPSKISLTLKTPSNSLSANFLTTNQVGMAKDIINKAVQAYNLQEDFRAKK